MGGVVLSRHAERDLRRIGAGSELARVRMALEQLSIGAANLDIKPLAGVAPWHRLRVGDLRVLYRQIEPGEGSDPTAVWLVARVVHRRDLKRAVSSLG